MGNWTTDPKNGRRPGSQIVTDDVMIGNTNNGNVTLNNNTTVNSLTINPSNALTNTSGTTLTVTTTVGNSGSLTLGGNLTAFGARQQQFRRHIGDAGRHLTRADLYQCRDTSGSLGTIIPAITNSGLVQASGGTLTAQKGIQGRPATSPSTPRRRSISATPTAGSTAASLAVNGNLNLGSQNLTVSTAYTNANFGTGNSFDKRANVTATGPDPGRRQRRADGDRQPGHQRHQRHADAGTWQCPCRRVDQRQLLDRQHRHERALADRRHPDQCQWRQYHGCRLSGSGVTAQNFGPVATGTSTSPFTVTYAPTTAGALTGQAVHLANNFGNVGEQTLSITGAAYNLASSNPITADQFRGIACRRSDSHQGADDHEYGAGRSLLRRARQQLRRLQRQWRNVDLGFAGSITNLAAGSPNSTSMVRIAEHGCGRVVNGTITVHQASNGTISGLANTALADQTPAVTATV